MSRTSILRGAYGATATLFVALGTCFLAGVLLGLDQTFTTPCGIGAAAVFVAHIVLAQARVGIEGGEDQ